MADSQPDSACCLSVSSSAKRTLLQRKTIQLFSLLESPGHDSRALTLLKYKICEDVVAWSELTVGLLYALHCIATEHFIFLCDDACGDAEYGAVTG
jgi:hypothetical protein